jgi:NAD(P)-dependent dehydrogenase (short-subunit alcohol dehydrogenase family)
VYLQKFRLEGRIALVTGGARGIGLSTAQALEEAGARVTITDLDEDAIDRSCRELSNAGHAVDGEVMNVT